MNPAAPVTSTEQPSHSSDVRAVTTAMLVAVHPDLLPSLRAAVVRDDVAGTQLAFRPPTEKEVRGRIVHRVRLGHEPVEEAEREEEAARQLARELRACEP